MENRPVHVEEPEPDAFPIAFIGALGAILVVVSVFFVQGLYERRRHFEFERKIVAETPRDLKEAREQQLAKFQPRWIDRGQGIVALPIERAMELVASSPNPAAPVGVP
jgi:hypothetical protein